MHCWVLSILNTANSLLAMIPEYQEIVRNHHFIAPDLRLDPDVDDFQYMIWKKKYAELGSQQVDEKADFIVATMPVWSLSPTDLYRFTLNDSLPSYNADPGVMRSRYNSAQRIWGKVCTKLSLYKIIMSEPS